jgi:transposase InsO family protein
MTSKIANMELYDAKITSIDGSFEMNVRLTKVDKGELLSISNPGYERLIKRYQHLQPVKMDDRDTKNQLPIHLVLGSGEFARIKTSTVPLIGNEYEPIAERTKLGWYMMSPGVEFDKTTMLLTQTSQADFEKLCRLDVLGLADTSEHDQSTVYEEFKENLRRDPAGWYEANLPWKPHHPHLPSNVAGSQRRLNNLIKRLERQDIYEQYDQIIQDQLVKGIVEPAPPEASGKEFYIPHKGVLKQTAETTKLRIVYDASARESSSQPSLNDCLNPGPPLQNHLWNILVRARFHPILLTGDLEKAFLQVRVKAEERDALRFHWRAPGCDVTSVYRFTRALFGLTCSPFLLGGVLHEHLGRWEEKHPELVREVRDNLYVDDLMLGGDDATKVREKRSKAIEVFEDATFHLHKWHSNVGNLEESEQRATIPTSDDETTFAKRQLGISTPNTTLLGLPWDKARDTISVVTNQEAPATTKRGALSHLAKVYDPLGLVSPTTLTGKLLFREMCEAGLSWDGEFPGELQERWKAWYERLPERIEVPRPLTPFHQPVTTLHLHAFGDASKDGVAAAVYAVVEQASGTTQGLVCSKSRLAKKNLTIPRLELVAGHMAANLVANVENAIGRKKVASMHCWLDSMVALYWINGQGEYRQFVANRVNKIRAHEAIAWHPVPTGENPADIGSRGGDVVDNELWQRGPSWLSDQSRWPKDVVVATCPEAERELKREQIAKVFTTVSNGSSGNKFDELLEKYTLRKTLRIYAWVSRFARNSRNRKRDDRESGPLVTEEIRNAEAWWIKRAQHEAGICEGFETVKRELNLQENEAKILECRGRIDGEYPVYLPQNHVIASKVVEQAHLVTLHGGVAMTMAKVRERFWIPKLRSLVKRVRSKCHGCSRFRSQAYSRPPPGNLPPSRTKGSTPFQVLGVDFAGPIRYQTKAKAERKAYLVLYGCSLTRAVHLDLLRSLELGEFLPSLRELIARRGRPEIIYSDNGSTFKAAERWLKRVQRDERFHEFLSDRRIEWRFNLSRAPWWGGQFERLIGLFKRAFYKSIGNGTLTWEELKDVVLEVEVALNNRPLSYVEDDVELSTLTPNSMLNINPSVLPELKTRHVEEPSLRKRAKFLKKCKEAMWKRWTREYVRSLRERHRCGVGKRSACPQIGEAVIIEDEDKNRNHWKLGIIGRQLKGRDGVVRGAKVRTAKGVLERAVQQLYPLELSSEEEKSWTPNLCAPVFQPRPKRDAATAAEVRIEQQATADQEAG